MQGDAVETAAPSAQPGFGPTVIGGIVGAAVGVGLHLLLETGILGTPRVEAAWFAIVIGLLTGLGVRWANKHHMERSYLRGAISAAIGLVAIYLSTVLIANVMANRDALAAKKPITGAAGPAAEEAEDAADGEAAGEAAAEPPRAEPGPAGLTGRAGRPAGPDDPDPWQFIFMALGALVAYELGRGIDRSKRAPAAGEPGEPLAGGTDVSA